MKRTALVLGAGIQGCCVALELLRAGHRVTLIDQADALMTRASFNQEGKIHLGFVYGLDRTGATGARMVHDALRFAPGLERLLERSIDWAAHTTRPFTYLVARESMLSVGETEACFRALATRWREERAADPELHYLGDRGDWFFERTPVPPELASDRFTAAFRTVETAVDQTMVRTLLSAALTGQGDCSFVWGEQVESVRPHGNAVIVHTRTADGEARRRGADLAVNCLWEDRDRIDRDAAVPGVGTEPPNLRLKFGLLTEPDPALAGLDSFTMVHGAFGDFVHGKDGHYFCWYPVSMRGMVRDWQVPPAWHAAIQNRFDAELSADLIQANEEVFRALIPALGPLRVRQLRAGVIVAKGVRNIDRRHTRLHLRKETPLRHSGGFWSVGTGKFTSGPANALALAAALEEVGR